VKKKARARFHFRDGTPARTRDFLAAAVRALFGLRTAVIAFSQLIYYKGFSAVLSNTS